MNRMYFYRLNVLRCVKPRHLLSIVACGLASAEKKWKNMRRTFHKYRTGFQRVFVSLDSWVLWRYRVRFGHLWDSPTLWAYVLDSAHPTQKQTQNSKNKQTKLNSTYFCHLGSLSFGFARPFLIISFFFAVKTHPFLSLCFLPRQKSSFSPIACTWELREPSSKVYHT